MKLREAIEILAKGYSYASIDDEKARLFDEALDIALLAVAAHEARCAASDVDPTFRNLKQDYANLTFMQLKAAERETQCLTELSCR